MSVFFLLLVSYNLAAQPNFDCEVRVGIRFEFNYTHEELKSRYAATTPGLMVFASSIFYGTLGEEKIGKNIQVNLGNTLSFYRKTIGNNWNPLNEKLQIDLVTTPTIGYASNVEDTFRRKYINVIGNSSAYNLYTKSDIFVGVSSNFVLNNRKRNQVVGAVTGSYKNVSVSYWNDWLNLGLFSLGDNFDRWWTAGVNLYVHSKDNAFNNFELKMGQFTGYSKQIYEMLKIIGMRVPKYYENDQNKNTTEKTYNIFYYKANVSLNENFRLSGGAVGNLRFGKNKNFYLGMQDIVHIIRREPLHPNDTKNKFQLGLIYDQSILNNFE